MKDEGAGEVYKAVTPDARVVKEDAPTLALKRPYVTPPKPKAKSASALPAQPPLIADFSPPTGGRSQRLKIVMGLGQPKNQAQLQTLVGALADEDSNIRWLAGSSLARLGGPAVVNMLAAFLKTKPGETAVEEAVKVLGLIADTAEDTQVQEDVRKAMQSG